jgi:hypothetical protein
VGEEDTEVLCGVTKDDGSNVAGVFSPVLWTFVDEVDYIFIFLNSLAKRKGVSFFQVPSWGGFGFFFFGYFLLLSWEKIRTPRLGQEWRRQMKLTVPSSHFSHPFRPSQREPCLPSSFLTKDRIIKVNKKGISVMNTHPSV